MILALYATSSHGDHPGHIVVGQEAADSAPVYLGYRFDILDLPEEYQDASKWRAFLFDNAIPGLIEDETARTIHQLDSARSGRHRHYALRVPCVVELNAVVPPREEWVPHARYSFNPDDFHTDSRPCYNCVSWAVMVANAVRPGTLEPVRQGRVKLIVLQLQEFTASGGEANG